MMLAATKSIATGLQTDNVEQAGNHFREAIKSLEACKTDDEKVKSMRFDAFKNLIATTKSNDNFEEATKICAQALEMGFEGRQKRTLLLLKGQSHMALGDKTEESSEFVKATEEFKNALDLQKSIIMDQDFNPSNQEQMAEIGNLKGI